MIDCPECAAPASPWGGPVLVRTSPGEGWLQRWRCAAGHWWDQGVFTATR